MGTLIPKSGGQYYYFREVYGDWMGFVYLFSWAFFVIPSGMAVIALTCAEYIAALFFNDGCGSAPQVIIKLLATTLLG